MPATPKEPLHPLPPRGVPQWLWPPTGARVRGFVITESVDARGAAAYGVEDGEHLAGLHLRGLQWLLDEHGFTDLPTSGAPFEGRILLEVARSELPGGRVGHAYALNGGPLGAPSGDGARGILRRYLGHRIARLRDAKEPS